MFPGLSKSGYPNWSPWRNVMFLMSFSSDGGMLVVMVFTTTGRMSIDLSPACKDISAMCLLVGVGIPYAPVR